MTGRIHQFPSKDWRQRTLDSVARIYDKAGLSPNSMHLALDELGEVLDNMPNAREFLFQVAVPLDAQHVAEVEAEHNRVIQEVIDHHSAIVSFLIQHVAGLIGRQYRS